MLDTGSLNSVMQSGIDKLAATCDCQQCGILTSVVSREPVQSPFKLKTPHYVQSVA